MPTRPDSAAQTALAGRVVRPARLCWMDIVGDPVRVTTYGSDLTPSGTGDPDLDGHTFSAVDPTMVSVGDIQMREGGTETVTASLSGLVGPDSALLAIIRDRSKWLGREARIWDGVELPDGSVRFWNLITARMSDIHIAFARDEQTIVVSLESYLAAISQASNRTYLDQAQFDPGDLSAAATIACANGIGGSDAMSEGGWGGGGGGGGFDRFNVNFL